MIMTVLGSCANQIANREGVALLIEKDNENLLIDCGPGIVAAFGRVHRKTSEVTNLLLTHVHGDHIAGFPYFVWNRNFECMGQNPPADLHVYGEKNTIDVAKNMIEKCYPELRFPFSVVYHIVNPRESIFLGKMTIDIVRADHAVPCISCVIKCDNKKLVYTSDSLYNTALEDYAYEADVLVHEGMMVKAMDALANRVKHSTSFMAGKFAYTTKAKQLILVHIAPALIGSEKVLLEEAAETYNGPISIPFDGSVYNI